MAIISSDGSGTTVLDSETGGLKEVRNNFQEVEQKSSRIEDGNLTYSVRILREVA
jgi:hypothetical protein